MGETTINESGKRKNFIVKIGIVGIFGIEDSVCEKTFVTFASSWNMQMWVASQNFWQVFNQMHVDEA